MVGWLVYLQAVQRTQARALMGNILDGRQHAHALAACHAQGLLCTLWLWRCVLVLDPIHYPVSAYSSSLNDR